MFVVSLAAVCILGFAVLVLVCCFRGLLALILFGCWLGWCFVLDVVFCGLVVWGGCFAFVILFSVFVVLVFVG